MTENQQRQLFAKKRRYKYKLRAIELKGGKCSACGYNKNAAALSFHHIKRNKNTVRLSNLFAKQSWDFIEKELAKTILLCNNCHRELHAKEQQHKKTWAVNRRRELKTKAIEYLGGKCSKCGYNKTITPVVFHHIDAATKEIRPARVLDSLNWDKIKKELKKTILLCENCHNELHHPEESFTAIPNQSKKSEQCSVEGCEQEFMANGLCRHHYTRMREYGTLTHEYINSGKICSIDDCGRVAYAKQFCRIHYLRLIQTGTVNKDLPIKKHTKHQFIGKRFGRLVVIKRVEDKQYGKKAHSQWLCQCDCGTEVAVVGRLLYAGDTKSCGCYQRESTSKRGVERWKEWHKNNPKPVPYSATYSNACWNNGTPPKRPY